MSFGKSPLALGLARSLRLNRVDPTYEHLMVYIEPRRVVLLLNLLSFLLIEKNMITFY